MAARRVCWLTRHGESEYNVLGLLGGNPSCSARGQQYAEVLPALLASRMTPDEARSLQVVTSTLRRTILTARNVPSASPQERLQELDEISAGVCDGMSYAEVERTMPPEAAARSADKLGYRYPRGESYVDVLARVAPVVERLRGSGGAPPMLVVAHQAVLRCVLGTLTAADPNSIPQLHIPLHTLLEVTLLPDGTATYKALPANLDLGARAVEAAAAAAAESTSAAADEAAALAASVLGGGGAARQADEEEEQQEQQQRGLEQIRVAEQRCAVPAT
ncbi:hypothetical protein FOA52_005199 [Chlamydomonas sp. UWO 241]|nr:hypothetical protein FOA52_005199 [Chlamydomonas sp. UWO 241]